MKSLYLLLDLFTLACPLVLSFEKRVHYFGAWLPSLLATCIIAIPFLIWDAVFTSYGYWGFNPRYNLGIEFFGLPIEEYLFFIVVPFACTFIYEVSKFYFSRLSFTMFNRILQIGISGYSLLLVFLGDSGMYTLTVQISSLIVLVVWMLSTKLKLIGVAFLISLIPFLVVNGILTGSFIDQQVVWYSEMEKVPYRIFTIPMEDVLYSFTLVVGNILVFEYLRKLLAK